MKYLLTLLLLMSPMVTFAATPSLQFSGWLPYWRKTAGTTDVISNIKTLDTISPFEFNVDAQGNLLDTAKLNEAPWTDLFTSAQENDVDVIPTILWGDKQPIHDVLRKLSSRNAHIKQIEDTILRDPRFAGVDIDYEGKSHETRKYFSFFLNTLSKKTKQHKKQLVCTIEPRTPIEDKVQVVDQALLDSIEFSNDYYVIGRSCDVVRIMAYDQGAIDIKLNAEKRGTSMYAPVADPAWVEKVIKLAIKDIPARKIELGVPTYGYIYELTPRTGGGYTYKRLRAINYPEAIAIASEYGVTPQRNSAGELSYSYPADEDPDSPLYGKINLVWFSDSQAIADKVKLARKYKLRGIAVFKFDGEHDGKLWQVLK